MAYGVGAITGQARPIIKGADGSLVPGAAGYGNTDNPGLESGTITTAGAGTLTNAALDGQLIYRTGPTAAFTDTSDTAANLDAGLGGGMNPGDKMVIWYSNQVAFAATIAAGTGVTLKSAKTSIAASALGCLILEKVTNAVPAMAYGTNGQQTGAFTTNGTYNLYVL